MKFAKSICLLGSVLLGGRLTQAIDLNINDDESIKSAASTVAYGMMKYYTGNHTGDNPGNLPAPYYWWEAGAVFGALVDYYRYTGDPSYNDATTQALTWQAGSNYDFMPENQTKTEGNDDQGFWAISAMSAAETNYPDPPGNTPGWLAMAQAVFNEQAARWDTESCGGGLRWQIFTFNNGYNYKNTISNGCFFNLAARLAKYTGNKTYADWAEKEWDWSRSVQLIGDGYQLYDGTDSTINCSRADHIQWTYNSGIYLLGAAAMYNYTGEDKWKQRVDGILNATDVFFTTDPPNVMYEVACEPKNTCNNDQRSFKAYLARWMAATTKMAPWTYDRIMTRLRASAQAAAAQCSGGTDGVTCGLKWTQGKQWDGQYGIGEQISALEVIQSCLISKVSAPVSNSTGGTSKGNPSAGSGGSSGGSGSSPTGESEKPVTTADKVGAGILTAVVLIVICGGSMWMII